MGGLSNTEIYNKVSQLVESIYLVSESFPEDDENLLKEHLRRTSIAIQKHVSDSYPKRKNEKFVIGKFSKAKDENSELRMWLKFASANKYLTVDQNKELSDLSLEIMNHLDKIIKAPKLFV